MRHCVPPSWSIPRTSSHACDSQEMSLLWQILISSTRHTINNHILLQNMTTSEDRSLAPVCTSTARGCRARGGVTPHINTTIDDLTPPNGTPHPSRQFYSKRHTQTRRVRLVARSIKTHYSRLEYIERCYSKSCRYAVDSSLMEHHKCNTDACNGIWLTVDLIRVSH